MKTTLEALSDLKNALQRLEVITRGKAAQYQAGGDTLQATLYRAQADGIRDSLTVVQDELNLALAEAKLTAFKHAFGEEIFGEEL